MNRICKMCGVEESKNIIFHNHHIIPKVKGGKDTILLCNDCHFSLHYSNHIDGDLSELEDHYKNIIENNIFGSGYGILPNRIGHDNSISDFSKVLYSEISSLCAARGYCWAKNKYFAKLFNKSEKTISRAINELEKFLIIKNRMTDNRIIFAHEFNEKIDRPHVNQRVKKVLKESIKKEKSNKIVKYSSDDLVLAELLLSKILYNFPVYENRKINIQDWAEDIRKLREINNATIPQISFMINWVHGGEIITDGKVSRKFEPHEFWSQNILSAKKLRKQWFENLVPKLQEALKKDIKKSTVAQL